MSGSTVQMGSPPPYEPLQNDVHFKGRLETLVGKSKIRVKQQIRWGEALTLGCCEQNNHYSVLEVNGPPGEETFTELFRVLEDSDCATRCFCSPLHTYSMKVVSAGQTEPMPDDPLLTHRVGCECIGCPKCLCCFSCNENCNNVTEVFTADPAQQGGFTIEKKVCNGCTVELVIFWNRGQERMPLAIIHGPTFFGGCAELCTDCDFFVTTCDKNCNITGSPGDVAKLRKLRPRGLCACLTECCTDVDNYEIDFNTNCSWNKDPNFLGMILGSLFTLDFMFFESDHPYLDVNSDGSCLLITICNFYCYGCICPVQLCIPLKGDN